MFDLGLGGYYKKTMPISKDYDNDTKYTPDCLDTIIKGLKEKGYEIVPISELILRGEYYMNHEGRQIEGSPETE